MIICPYCGSENREGVYFCAHCGQTLTESTSVPTLPTRKLEDTLGVSAVRATWGTANLGETTEIVIQIQDVTEALTIALDRVVSLGRIDRNHPRQPDVDLTPFGALEKGVSRIHATIEINANSLMLIDLGSSNGTSLNGQRLLPNQPSVLRDGDEVHLGKLVTHIYFSR